MKYTYLEHSIYIKEPVGVYLRMFKELKKVNEDVRKKLNNTILYNGENHFETLIGIVLSSISDGVRIVVDSLNSLGWNTSEEEFVVGETECFSIIISVLEQYEEDYYNIVQEIAGMKVYRNIRQATRGRFIGGGQGIDGIIKGALTAATANLVVGTGYTVANFIGNVGTRLKVEKKTQDLTKSIRDLILKEKLIEVTLKNLELVFLQKCSHPDCGVYLQEYDINHTEYNVKPNFLMISDEEHKRQAYFSIIESIPYCPVIYKTLLMEYGDSKKELQVLAKDYDVDLDRIKKDLLKEEAAKLLSNKGSIIEQMLMLEKKYSYYDNQLEQEICKRYLDDFIDDNGVDYLSRSEVTERVSFLKDFSKKYQFNVEMYIKNIKEFIIKAYNIDLSGENSLQGLKNLEEKITHLSVTYEMNFEEYMTTVQSKINKVLLDIQKEEKEKRTVYDISEISIQQGIIRKRKVILDSQEDAQNVQKRIDEICNLFDAMNFEICDKQLFEQFNNIEELVNSFSYCKKIIEFIKIKKSQMKFESNCNKTDIGSDGVKSEFERINDCSYCGAIIKEGYKFCFKCGNKIL